MPDRRSRAYEAVFSAGAAAFVVEQPKRVQRSLIALVVKLAEQPTQLGNYSVKDSTGRDLQVLKVGRFTFTYWADDAVKELRIIEIEIL